MGFRWIAWNAEHIAEHGVSVNEAQFVVTSAGRPYPEYLGDGRYLVRGKTAAGAYVQVIFIRDPDTDDIFVIHARPLSSSEKRQFRRRRHG